MLRDWFLIFRPKEPPLCFTPSEMGKEPFPYPSVHFDNRYHYAKEAMLPLFRRTWMSLFLTPLR
jgi:hypothetical protein